MQIPVRIVLVGTTHPGNIGAVARAMKTMGLGDLALVSPKYFPHAEATARASGADDILARARVTGDFTAAIEDASFVLGASARTRSGRWPVLDPRHAAGEILARLATQSCAIVMGPEQSGLSNDELARCHALVHIPTAPEYGSLNLAMAVQVLCYEIRMAALAAPASAALGSAPSNSAPSGSPASASALSASPERRDAPAATAAEIEGLHEHLERVLTRSGFLHPAHPKQLRLKLRRLFMRAELDRNEINILRGALASLDPERAKTADDHD